MSTIIKKPRSRPTIDDVARLSGFTKGTVSRALSHPASRSPLREETRQRIVAVAERLGYRPNYRAQSLTRRQTHCVGYFYGQLVPHTHAVGFHSRAMAARLTEHNFDLQYVPAVGPAQHWQDKLLGQRFDGCLVGQAVPVGIEALLMEYRIPAVLLNIASQFPLTQVRADDRAGTQRLLEHLFEHGHRRIALLLDERHVETDHYSVFERQNTFLQTMQKAGYAEHARVHRDDPASFAHAIAQGNASATAVICYRQTTITQMLHACWEQGLRVPQDLSVTGFDDESPTVPYLIPPVTTVRVPFEQMGERAAELLLDQLKNGLPEEPVIEVLPEPLTIRQSVGPPPA